MKSVESVKKETLRLVSNAIWIAECHDKGHKARADTPALICLLKYQNTKSNNNNCNRRRTRKTRNKGGKNNSDFNTN